MKLFPSALELQEVSLYLQCQAGGTAVELLRSVLLPTVISLCVQLWGWVEGGSGIPWNSPNPENCNEGVARLQSIGPFVSCCMDSAVLQGASTTHNALQIPLPFRFNKEEVGGYSMIWFAKLKSCLFFPGGGRKCPFWTLPLHFLWSHPVNHVTLSRGLSADGYLFATSTLFTVLRLKTCLQTARMVLSPDLGWLFPPLHFLCC